jgi:hypothetical protein
LSVHLLFAALSRDGALWQSLSVSADAAAMSTFVEGGLYAVTQICGARRRAFHAVITCNDDMDMDDQYVTGACSAASLDRSARSNASAWRRA